WKRLVRPISSLQATTKRNTEEEEEGYKDLPGKKLASNTDNGGDDDESIGRSGRYV
ncbi:unnamed protein product, partial [Arabidopsis halleri]